MNRIRSYLLVSLFIGASTGWNISSDDWISEKHISYNYFYKITDKQNKNDYLTLIDNGIKSVKLYFGGGFNKKFEIYVHPNRQSLDSQWQKDWKMPDFKSECWMVASGVAQKLDIISPKNWDKESCEHIYSNKIKTQQLITHELFHVYHGQLNICGDFSDTENIDWFVEGLATYASGQCDSLIIGEVKSIVMNNKFPKSLNDFWKGKLRYGLSGSVVMFIDFKYGRGKIKELLKFNKKSAILTSLNITEENLLDGWKKYFEK